MESCWPQAVPNQRWNVDSGAEVRPLPGNGEPIRSLAWSHHSSALAAADGGGTIFVWNADSGALLRTWGDQDQLTRENRADLFGGAQEVSRPYPKRLLTADEQSSR